MQEAASAGPFTATALMPTSEGLGALRRELVEEGFHAEEAFEIVMAHVKANAHDGFAVKAKSEVPA